MQTSEWVSNKKATNTSRRDLVIEKHPQQSKAAPVPQHVGGEVGLLTCGEVAGSSAPPPKKKKKKKKNK